MSQIKQILYLRWQSSGNFLRCSGSCARTCIRWAQKWQPIPHSPPRRAGRCPNQTVRCFLPGPQELWDRLPMRAQADWCFRNLRTPGHCQEKSTARLLQASAAKELAPRTAIAAPTVPCKMFNISFSSWADLGVALVSCFLELHARRRF